MILEIEEKNGVVQATILASEASLANAERFKEEMMTVIANGAKLILLSFEKVNYIDSSFLVALKFAMPRNADICLVSLKPDVKNLLTLIRMDKVFKIYKDFGQAMEILA
jgi:anti-sigma B factor antagonist